MATLANIAQNTRLRLAEPRAQKPSGRAVLQAVTTEAQSLIDQIGDSGQPWALGDDYQLNVVNGEQDYLLPFGPSFGKVVQVLTYYPQNLGIPQRYVHFENFNDMNYSWPWPPNVASYMFTDGSPNTAQRIAFYRKGGTDDIWCRVYPMPALAATYLVSWSIGSWADDAGLDSSPVLNQFHNLLEIEAALSLIPHCEWVDDQNENRARRRELTESLQRSEAKALDGFQRYVRSLTSDHLVNRVGASGDYGSGWY